MGIEVRDEHQHPDIVDFFHRFGLNMFVGSLNIKNDLGKKLELDAMFGEFNEFLKTYNDSDRACLDRRVYNAYFSKIIYQDFLSGKTWHTPICVIYDHDRDKFLLTKGAKKILASEMIGIETLPTVVLARKKTKVGKNLARVSSDQELYDFIGSLAGNQMKDPYIGIEYYDFDNLGKIPIIHWINISQDSGERINYQINLAKDIKFWRKFPDRLVTSDVFPDSESDYYTHQLMSGLLPDSKIIRQNMPKTAVAHVYSSKDPVICRKLINALAWLNTDADNNAVGETVSACGRYKIVFNNKSDIITEIPRGILNK